MNPNKRIESARTARPTHKVQCTLFAAHSRRGPRRPLFLETCMKKLISLITALIAVAALGASAAPASGDRSTTQEATDPLFETISALDTAVFDAFNNCSSPEQLQKHASYFAPDVEFYHDTGGVTWSRQEMLTNTAKYVCGNFRRELVPDTLKVFPIKDFGAIAQGSHRFCQFASGKCEGIADFVIVWSNQSGHWQITRVLSFGHRANK